MRKLNFIEERNDFKTVVHSLFTDARGGETHEGLATKMPKWARIIDLSSFLIVIYCLHVMNCMIQSSCKKYFNSGRALSWNYVQLLYICYVLQKEYELNKWSTMQKNTCGLPFSEMFPTLVYARWKYIGIVSVQSITKLDSFLK